MLCILWPLLIVSVLRPIPAYVVSAISPTLRVDDAPHPSAQSREPQPDGGPASATGSPLERAIDRLSRLRALRAQGHASWREVAEQEWVVASWKGLQEVHAASQAQRSDLVSQLLRVPARAESEEKNSDHWVAAARLGDRLARNRLEAVERLHQRGCAAKIELEQARRAQDIAQEIATSSSDSQNGGDLVRSVSHDVGRTLSAAAQSQLRIVCQASAISASARASMLDQWATRLQSRNLSDSSAELERILMERDWFQAYAAAACEGPMIGRRTEETSLATRVVVWPAGRLIRFSWGMHDGWIWIPSPWLSEIQTLYAGSDRPTASPWYLPALEPARGALWNFYLSHAAPLRFPYQGWSQRPLNSQCHSEFVVTDLQRLVQCHCSALSYPYPYHYAFGIRRTDSCGGPPPRADAYGGPWLLPGGPSGR